MFYERGIADTRLVAVVDEQGRATVGSGRGDPFVHEGGRVPDGLALGQFIVADLNAELSLQNHREFHKDERVEFQVIEHGGRGDPGCGHLKVLGHDGDDALGNGVGHDVSPSVRGFRPTGAGRFLDLSLR
jgi:hypothetical protein